jgi:hypothetical protein
MTVVSTHVEEAIMEMMAPLQGLMEEEHLVVEGL